MANLGLMNFLGQGGLTQDKQRALVLIKLAADQCHVEARVALPRIREMGLPPPSVLVAVSSEHGPGFQATEALWGILKHKKSNIGPLSPGVRRPTTGPAHPSFF